MNLSEYTNSELNAWIAEHLFGLNVTWEDPTGFGIKENYGPA